ncbi:MAG TPA: cupin domain-containing protein [Chloroflexota bacterium]|jgi:hypothetical protein
MAAEVRGFDSPKETRQFKGHGKLELVDLMGGMAGRGTFEPGWKWSEDVKPIAGTASCQAAHTGYVVSGAMHIAFDDGSALDVKAGEVFHMPPGHDAWTVGNAACVLVDFSGVQDYAKPH